LWDTPKKSLRTSPQTPSSAPGCGSRDIPFFYYLRTLISILRLWFLLYRMGG
jgi:hypothetical protein